MKPEVTKEMVDSFFNAEKSKERIIKIECEYNDENVIIIYRDEKGMKKAERQSFHPFLWTKKDAATKLFNGDRTKLKQQMARYGIGCKGLRTEDADGNTHPRMENGYRIMFFAKMPMSYSKFLKFFEEAGRPVYPKMGDANYGSDEYVVVSPVEQYMISTGQRMFKGVENYNDLVRLEWDLETEGLDPEINAISQIGIRTNKGFEKIISVEGEGAEKQRNEIVAIREFFVTVKNLDPDVITGHNTENFDWNFIDVRLQKNGYTLVDFTKDLFYGKGIYKKKKEQVLKLGGEMEYYHPTVMWGHNITDSLFAVRRAQALDSNIKKADLKYITKYAKLAKPNRVYVPGKMINTIWLDKEKNYGFNEENGKWFKIDDKLFSRTFINDNNEETVRYVKVDEKIYDNKEKEYYSYSTGRYIVQRYLLDDLWESDKVEDRYNETNFLIAKLVPITFEKACTTGTAALWKFILLAWSYENNLAIPELTPSRKFTGGLSRLIKVGFIGEQYKLDFNSLYPSIILSWGIESEVDVMCVMTTMLEYVLTEREKSKDLKKKWGKTADKLKEELKKTLPNSNEYGELQNKIIEAESNKNRYDKDQSQKKVLGNSFFGAYGSGSSSGFYWSDVNSAEMTTCTGRQMLRLMISHFKNLGGEPQYGYEPIVGDSFTEDTPLFIKYNDTNLIDIKTIKSLINEEQINIDELGREYDYSKKPYKVLCRSGWVEPSYIYRHETDKPIYEVTENNVCVEVTEDHSLFDNNRNKIKPTEITKDTTLEYYNSNNIFSEFNTLSEKDKISDSWQWLLNANLTIKRQYLDTINENQANKGDKIARARILFIKNCVLNDEL